MALPAVLKVTLKLFVPATRAVSAGEIAFRVAGTDINRIGDGVDEVPVGVHGVDRHIEAVPAV